MAITRLNHAVLFVRDADVAAAFYHDAFGFEELTRPQGMRAAFMRSPAGGNHHDLGLFEVGADAPRPPRGSVGLYHLAWQIDTIEGLAEMAERLRGLGALTGASDHGVSKSLYGRDPDGNEFEVMWEVPREAWGRFEDEATIMPLDLEAELRRWGAGASVQLSAAGGRPIQGASESSWSACSSRWSTMKVSMIRSTGISPRTG